MPPSFTIRPAIAEESIRKVLVANGANDRVATDVADALVRASLRGIDSHGIELLPSILKRVEAGRCQLSRPIQAINENTERACVVFDANLAPGQHAGMAMARAAADRAKRFGIGMACVRNSTHFGAVAPYVEFIVENGMVGFVGSNSTPSMAAFGATFPNLGNNPLGFGAPVKDGPDLVVDFSCGVMSFGRLAKLQADGQPVPQDAFIKPTDIPQDGPVYEIAGDLKWAALPFGGYKGASIAMMIEVLSGVLSGGNFGMKTETMDGGTFRGPSHFAMAFSPNAFGIVDVAKQMETYVNDIAGQNATLRIPGDRASRVIDERSAAGIKVSQDLVAVLGTNN